jgi:hypothetical protein
MAQTDKQQQLALMQQMVAQRSWVKTPWNYTKLSGGLSLIQQQALLMVSEHLQGYIRKFYELKLDKARNTPKSLFTEHVLREGIPPFRIYLQDLGIEPSNYGAARKAIDEINLQVEYTVTDEQGHPTDKTELANVFTTFGFEKTGDYYHYTNKQGKADYTKMQQPYIDVKINPDVAIWAFNMQDGYVNHLKMIAMYSTKRSTPRIYLMLMKRMRKEQRQADIRIPFGELKEYLGIAPNAYPMFRSFRQKVLDAVQQDLQRMAAEVPPQTDITFTYDLCYPGRRKMGDPEAILFHVERTSLGMAYGIVVSKARLPIEPDMFATDPQQQPYRDAFGRMMAELLAVAKTEQGREVFQSLRFEHYDEARHTVLVQLTDKRHYDFLESAAVQPHYLAALRRHFGDDAVPLYRLPKD